MIRIGQRFKGCDKGKCVIGGSKMVIKYKVHYGVLGTSTRTHSQGNGEVKVNKRWVTNGCRQW